MSDETKAIGMGRNPFYDGQFSDEPDCWYRMRREVLDALEAWKNSDDQKQLRADAERLDWIMLMMSGKEARRLGIMTSAGMVRGCLDSAIEKARGDMKRYVSRIGAWSLKHKYLIWCPDYGQTEADARSAEASNPAAAVELWASQYDWLSSDYLIVNGQRADVLVKIDDEVLRYCVRGDMVAKYYAHKVETATALEQDAADDGGLERLRSAITNIMYVAHYGGLEGLSEPESLINIRRLSLPWLDTTDNDIDTKLRVVIAQQAQDESA